MKEIDLLKNEQKTPEYEEINPNKTVPALTHGDIKAGFQIFQLFLTQKAPLIGWNVSESI